MSALADAGATHHVRCLKAVPSTDVSKKDIEAFCRRWNVAKLSAFGTVLDENFDMDVNLGFVVVFESRDMISLLTMALMEEELREMFDPEVLLMTPGALERDINIRTGRREIILGALETVYEA